MVSGTHLLLPIKTGPLARVSSKQCYTHATFLLQGTADAVRQYNWMFDDVKNRIVQDIVILSGDHLCVVLFWVALICSCMLCS